MIMLVLLLYEASNSQSFNQPCSLFMHPVFKSVCTADSILVKHIYYNNKFNDKTT